ncbi:MAG: bifunctional glutamate N-acetyltransferase/amino-acid acetyltransferase ArgJ [Elusimicrobia bacterium]|nr:bifunctional glutamate N-acetyltransferase/amino-acid acetyltransferase ArgJ [Elusimicrobiota bacterium]
MLGRQRIIDMFPKGFVVNGVHCGIAKKKDKLDLALFFSDRPCVAAGMFTSNFVKAAPVLISQDNLKKNKNCGMHAIIANSGCANACTGVPGKKDAGAMGAMVARSLSLGERAVVVASTGVIGKRLPMSFMTNGISAVCKKIAAGENNPVSAVKAIMTTDTAVKIVARTLNIGAKRVTIWGCVKGAGMIHPDLVAPHATMLSFILTDAALAPSFAQRALKAAVAPSFNCVSVDGDTSTNDTILLLANGAAGNTPISAGTLARAFSSALNAVCLDLAKMVARDGEGANHLVTVTVRNAATAASAKKIAATIATSPLVKTAVFGADANWGRVIAAVGRSGEKINPDTVDIYFDGLSVARNGAPVDFSEKKAKKILQQKELTITVDVRSGTASATYYTCDLSLDYVKINANYRT